MIRETKNGVVARSPNEKRRSFIDAVGEGGFGLSVARSGEAHEPNLTESNRTETESKRTETASRARLVAERVREDIIVGELGRLDPRRRVAHDDVEVAECPVRVAREVLLEDVADRRLELDEVARVPHA